MRFILVLLAIFKITNSMFLPYNDIFQNHLYKHDINYYRKILEPGFKYSSISHPYNSLLELEEFRKSIGEYENSQLNLEKLDMMDLNTTLLENSLNTLSSVLAQSKSINNEHLIYSKSYFHNNKNLDETIKQNKLLDYVVKNAIDPESQANIYDDSIKKDSIEFLELLNKILIKLKESEESNYTVSKNFINYLKYYLSIILNSDSNDKSKTKIDKYSITKIINFLNKYEETERILLNKKKAKLNDFKELNVVLETKSTTKSTTTTSTSTEVIEETLTTTTEIIGDTLTEADSDNNENDESSPVDSDSEKK